MENGDLLKITFNSVIKLLVFIKLNFELAKHNLNK